MSCRVLLLSDETFGPSIVASAVMKEEDLQRGEWLGLTLAKEGEEDSDWVSVPTDTYDINGTSITVTRQSASSVLADVAGRQVLLPWRAQLPGATSLLAAKFRDPADFVVVRDADSSVTPPQWRLWVFDVRSAAVPPPTMLGPFEVPLGDDLNVCPNGNGQLLLLWHGTQSGVAHGRKAWVCRTEVDSSVVPDLVTITNPAAQGTIGAQIEAAARQITLFDNANRGSTSVTRTVNSQNLASNALPSPGKLSITPQSLTLGSGDDFRPLTIKNVGGDFLSLDGITVYPPGVVSIKLLVADSCIPPRGAVPVEIDRATKGAATAVVTVATTPAASPAASGRLSVDVAAKLVAPPNPKLSVAPAALGWRSGTSQPRIITLTNSGNVALEVSVEAPPAGSGFDWAPVAQITLPVNAPPITVSVQPKTTGPDHNVVIVHALASGAPLAGFPLPVPVAKNVPAKVPVGAMRITALIADPPGSDILPEGEFIEVANVSGMPLDLTGTSITHEQRSTPSSHPQQRTLITFGANALGADSLLAPLSTTGRPLRILTRKREDHEPTDPLRCYAGRKAAVWNNAGDTARVINEFGEIVDTYTYVASYAAGGASDPATHVVLPGAKQHVATRRVFVDARTEWTTVFPIDDGDVLHVRDVTGTISLGGIFGSSGTSGPNGRAGSTAPADCPLPGAPAFCLIGCFGRLVGEEGIDMVGTPFFVGADSVVTVAADETRAGLTFFLGVNDSVLTDNGGTFDAAVDLSR